MTQVWLLIVLLNGTIADVLPWTSSLAQCEATALQGTTQGQQQRAAAGLPPNGNRAYCVTGREPVRGATAPRPGVQT